MSSQTQIYAMPVFSDEEMETLFDASLPSPFQVESRNQPTGEFFFELQPPGNVINLPGESSEGIAPTAHPLINSAAHTAPPKQTDHFEIILKAPSSAVNRLIPANVQPWPKTQPMVAPTPLPPAVPAKNADQSLRPAISATMLPALPVNARTELPSAWSNELRHLSSTILVAAKSKKHRVFLVCDVTPGTGAKVITRGLSQTLTGLCKANVVYCGLSGKEMTTRQPAAKTSHALQRNEPFYLRQTGQPNLQEMTTSSGEIAMSDLLLRYDLPFFISQLKREFDLVLFDAPPITLNAEVELLAAHVDGVILVVRPGVTSMTEIQKVQSRLQKAEANILGVVFHEASKQRPRLF